MKHIYARLSFYADGELLSVHETHEGALRAWAETLKVGVSELSTETREWDEGRETVIYRGIQRGYIKKCEVKP